MNLQTIPTSGNSVVPANDNFDAIDWSSVYAKDATTTTALTWGYLGGRWGGFSVSAGTLSLTNAATNYIVVLRSNGVISTSTTSTNWDNSTSYARVYKLTTAGSVVTATEDHRAGAGGVHAGASAAVPGSSNVGYLNIPQNSQSAAYTTVLADSGKHIFHPSSDNNPRTFTIDSNANVAYDLGTVLTFVNKINTVTIAITSDTLTWAGVGSTGSRTLAANGIATVLKVATTEWLINGVGIT